jgi:DNA-binding response OmpR family regulator
MRLLIVEDDVELATGLKRDLETAGFAVDTADNGVDAEFLGQEVHYDAVVLDLGLPHGSGLDVLRRWRAAGNRVAVLVLTARDAWYEKVEGFKAGADDYLGKPFHLEELIARLNALIRRGGGQGGSRLEVAGLVLDEDRRVVIARDGSESALTATEFRLLRYLMRHPDRVLSKVELTTHCYAEEADRDSNVLEVYVRRLRRKIGAQHIQTVRGQGYLFSSRSP